MNLRLFNRLNCIRSPPIRAELQDIELASISQEVAERFYNPLAVGGLPMSEVGRYSLQISVPSIIA